MFFQHRLDGRHSRIIFDMKSGQFSVAFFLTFNSIIFLGFIFSRFLYASVNQTFKVISGYKLFFRFLKLVVSVFWFWTYSDNPQAEWKRYGFEVKTWGKQLFILVFFCNKSTYIFFIFNFKASIHEWDGFFFFFYNQIGLILVHFKLMCGPL